MEEPIVIWNEGHQELLDLERILTDIATSMLYPQMYSRCLDCQTWGNCFPYDRRCGNCHSLNISRYYSEGAINELLIRARGARGEPICDSPIIAGGKPTKDFIQPLPKQTNTSFREGRPFSETGPHISDFSNPYSRTSSGIGTLKDLSSKE